MSDETRAFVQGRLAEVRAALAQAVGGLSEGAATAIRVTSAWTLLDTLRHIAAWQDLALAALDTWTGERETLPIGYDEDAVNARLLAERQHVDLAAALARIDANLARLEALLQASDAALAEEAEAPWGGRATRLMVISGILWHDGQHLAQIAAARTL